MSGIVDNGVSLSVVSPSAPLLSSSSSHSHSHPSHSDSSLFRPSHDPYLSTLRLFWYIFWAFIAELFFLICLVINYTALTSIAESKEEGPQHELKLIRNEENNSEADVKPGISIIITFLYFVPSCLVLFGSLLVFFSKKNNYLVRKVLFGIVIFSVFSGFAGAIYAFYAYVYSYSAGEECEEFEGWTVSVVRTLYAVLTLSPLAYRIALAVALRADYTLYSGSLYSASAHGSLASGESAFALPPVVDKWRKFLKGLDSLIMICCMPVCLRDSKTSEHTRHIQQHVIQLIYEIVLLIVAVVEHKYIELIAIVAGLLGSLFGLGHLYMLDSIFNAFALLTGLFLLGNNAAKISCAEEVGVKLWVYLIVFSLIATTIRFKSFVHTFLEGRMQIYNWLHDQIGWLSLEIPEKGVDDVINYNLQITVNRVFQIQNFVTLRKYGDTHGKNEEEKNEKTPLVAPPPQPVVSPAVAKSKAIFGITFLIGMSMIIGFSITMGILVPSYKGGVHVNELMRWNQSECHLYSSQVAYNPKIREKFYYYYVTTTDNQDIVAMPVQYRYVSGRDIVEGSVKWTNNNMYKTLPCRVPSTPLSSKLNPNLDFDKKSPLWDKVAIIGSDADLNSLKTKYYVWMIIPPFGIFFGILVLFSTCIYEQIFVPKELRTPCISRRKR